MGREVEVLSAGVACKAILDLLQAEKEGTFHRPGLPPERGWDGDSFLRPRYPIVGGYLKCTPL